MALGQTLALPKTLLLCTPSTPLFPSSSTHLHPSPPQTVKTSRRLSAVKSSLTYINSSSVVPQYPRPAEIPWQKEIANCVHLIGYVATTVQIRYLPDGKTVALCRITVAKSPLEQSSITLSFWDELAHTAFQHFEKGSQIYVRGRLVVDTVETEDGKNQSYYKVNVKEMNFIERTWGDSTETGKKLSAASREELWQAFFANPADWWDNRKGKSDGQKSPRYPDFKHKHTSESLWIEGKFNPPWVKSQLEILDARREAFGFQDRNEGMNGNFGAGDNFSAL